MKKRGRPPGTKYAIKMAVLLTKSQIDAIDAEKNARKKKTGNAAARPSVIRDAINAYLGLEGEK